MKTPKPLFRVISQLTATQKKNTSVLSSGKNGAAALKLLYIHIPIKKKKSDTGSLNEACVRYRYRHRQAGRDNEFIIILLQPLLTPINVPPIRDDVGESE